MKKRIVFTAIAVTLLASAATAGILFFQGSLSDAVARARSEKKPVMIDFVTDWCRWCDTLETNTYADRTVADYVNGNIVPIKIDAEKGEGIDIAKRYGVRAYPTILFLRADGEEIDRLVGYLPPGPFLKSVRDFVGGVNTVGALKSQLEKNPTDPALQYAMASKLAGRNDMAGAVEFYKTLLALDPHNTLGHNEEAEYSLAVNALRAEKRTAPLEGFLDKYPNAPMTRNALMTVISAAANLGDAIVARRYFDRYVASWPTDAMMMNNYAWQCAEKKINLEHAATVAARAVELAVDDGQRAMFLDTEAAVAFERGDAVKAVALEEKALSFLKNASPKDRKDYEDALARFTAGRKP